MVEPKQADDMTTIAKAKPLPTWSRALITFVALGMIGALATVIGITAVVKHQYDISTDQKAIVKLARTMILLSDPLPPGYKYVLGIDLALFQTISIDYDNGKDDNQQRLVFLSCPTVENRDAKEMLTQSFEQGIVPGEKFTDVLSEGGWVIHDTQIPYRIGRLSGGQGTGLVACVVDQERKRALILYSVQPKGANFDTTVCTTLFESADDQTDPAAVPNVTK
jgi:hypothetical protein